MSGETTDVEFSSGVGQQWVQLCLEGSICLGRMLLPALDLKKGRVVVLGSRGELPQDDLEDLRASVEHLGVLTMQDSAAAALKLLRSLETVVGEIAIVSEDYLREPDNKRIVPLLAEERAVVADEKVFHIRKVAALSTTSDVIEVLSQGSEYPLNALILKGAAADHFTEWVEHGDVKSLVDALLGTIHVVYDAEGYVAWVRAVE
jgi:hypothetical protein